MNAPTNSSTAQATDVATLPITYRVTVTEAGQWMHSQGTDFLFAFIDNTWDAGVKAEVTAAFLKATKMSTEIKNAVLATSGQTVVNGLYLLDQPAMTRAMNSITGMGMTEADQNHKSGSGTALSITGEFFGAVLGGLGGDVAPMLSYLTTQMGDVQAQTRTEKTIDNFGTVIGLISAFPELDVVTTTFQYAFSSSDTSAWFVKVNCGSVEHESYDYAYTVVSYNYVP